MGRLALVGLLIALALAVGYLANDGEDAAPARAAGDARAVRGLEIRVLELEQRLELLASRLHAGPDAASEPRRLSNETAPERKGNADTASDTATPQERAQAREEHKRQWLQRFRDARTTPARLAALRDARVQLERHSGKATLKEFLEEIRRTTDPASEEGTEAALALCYAARGEGDYARSDALLHEIERLAAPDSARYAETQFQLAWNRKFAGEPAAAEDLFRRAADATGVRRSTRVAAWYNLASLRSDAGDAAESKELLQRIVDAGKRHPADQGVAYYVGLAKRLLAAAE